MAKSNGSVMREIALDQYMAVETTHFRNGKNTDGTEGTGGYRQNLALGNITAQFCISGTLQTEESNVSRYQITFQSSVGHFDRKTTGHNLLIAHFRIGHFTGSGIAAVESHENIGRCVWMFALDVLAVNIIRNGVVDIQQGYCVLADNGADKFAESTINIYFTGYRDTSGGETAVDIAWNKAKLGLKSRPAFSGNGYIFAVTFVVLNPV